jgi:hypothetical protein
MDQGLATLLAASLATAAAVLGYVLTQMVGRRDRQAQRFAEALLAVYEYQESAYRILRRADESGPTRERLGELHGKAANGIRYHFALLKVESPLVAEAYYELFLRTRQVGSVFRAWAWSRPPLTNDAGMSESTSLVYGNDDEINMCLRCMRHELSWWRRPWRRRALFTQISVLRAESGLRPRPTTFAEVEQMRRQAEQERRRYEGQH